MRVNNANKNVATALSKKPLSEPTRRWGNVGSSIKRNQNLIDSNRKFPSSPSQLASTLAAAAAAPSEFCTWSVYVGERKIYKKKKRQRKKKGENKGDPWPDKSSIRGPFLQLSDRKSIGFFFFFFSSLRRGLWARELTGLSVAFSIPLVSPFTETVSLHGDGADAHQGDGPRLFWR